MGCLSEIFAKHPKLNTVAESHLMGVAQIDCLKSSIVHYALHAAKIGGHFLDVEKSSRPYSSL